MSVEVGGNGSIHWRVRHNQGDDINRPGNGQAQGKDPNNREFIDVEVIYDSADEANEGLKAAMVRGSSVWLRVRAHTDNAPGYSARAQVKVDW